MWSEGARATHLETGTHWSPVILLPLTAPVFSVHIRFDILDQEMKTLITQIDGVNLAANNLVESGHPRSGEVKQYQDRLNKRWGVGRAWVWVGVLS